jgi:small nuclear ribonucleoprotein (snRNP)-like protein
MVWRFEPKVALEVLYDYIKENELRVKLRDRIKDKGGVEKRHNSIVSITLESNKVYEGKYLLTQLMKGT